MKKILCILILLFLNQSLSLASGRIHGFIKEKESGELLPGVNVYLKGTEYGAVTNSEGYYNISELPSGTYYLVASFIGYAPAEKKVELQPNSILQINLELTQQPIQAQEVIVTAERTAYRKEIQLNKVVLNPMIMRRIPQFGEMDLFRTLQLLPGVTAQSDFQAGLIVRGGNTDQNLILLDGIEVYNPSHLGGLFSNFIPEALKNAELIKGGFPAEYGGRLSAVLNVLSKDGNNKKVSGSGEISVISSKLMMEGPLRKGGWLFAARRTYMDQLLKVLNKANLTDFRFPYYFYDFQANLYTDPNDKDRFRLSAYAGDDVLRWQALTADFRWGNRTVSSRWRHLFTESLFSSFLLASSYFYTSSAFGGDDAIKSRNDIYDITSKGKLTYFKGKKRTFNFGYELKFLKVSYNSEFNHEKLFLVKQRPVYSALFFQYLLTPPRLVIKTGIRLHHYNKTESPFALSPRLAIKFLINPISSLSLSAGRYYQFIFTVNDEFNFQAINNWVALDNSAPGQYADQISFGYDRRSADWFNLSVELYYKRMYNLLVYRNEQAAYDQGYINPVVIDLFVPSTATAFGTEILLQKDKGRFHGMFSYTLSWVIKRIKDEPLYWANWDQRHVLKFLASYHFSKKWEFGSVFIFNSGLPYTRILGSYVYFEPGYAYPFYYQIPGSRNNARVPPYHRLDISLTRHFEFNKWNMDFYLQMLNIYNHENVLFVYWETDVLEYGQPATKEESTMFPFIPTLGFRFSF